MSREELCAAIAAVADMCESHEMTLGELSEFSVYADVVGSIDEPECKTFGQKEYLCRGMVNDYFITR